MSEWKEVYLNEAYSIRSGLSKPASEFGSGFPFLSFKEVFNNFFVPKILLELVQSTDKERLGCSIERGDVFLTRTSETIHELGMSCVALKNYENATFNGFTKRLRPKGNPVIVPEYAGYYFRSPRFRAEVTALSSSSTRASLNNDMIGRLTIRFPSEKEQKAIADVLSCLDGKVENLRRQNETLEAIAQTLFKHWFMDFEFPNEDGKPYKSSGGAMIPSELGEIPAGWRVGTLGEVLTLNYGKSLTANTRIAGEYPVVGSNGIVDYHNDFIVKAPGIVIGRKGTIGKVIWLEKDFYPIDTTFYISDNLNCKYLYFYYFLLQNQDFRKLMSDSAVPGLNRDMAYSVELALSDINLINKFNQIIKVFISKKEANIKQIQTITKTRDTLLPKLMSGQLRVKEQKL